MDNKWRITVGSIGRAGFVFAFLCGCGLIWAADQEGQIELGPPPGSCQVLSGDGSIRIPFDVFRDDIRMEAEVNGVDLKLLLDNGFLWDQLLFWGSPTIDSLRLEMDGEIAVGGSGDGEPVVSRTASHVTVRFDDVVFHDQVAVVTPSSSGVAELWAGSHGQLSSAFFKHFVVKIDWDTSVITLIPPQDFDPEGQGSEIPMTHIGSGAWAIPAELELTSGGRRQVLLQLDLGDGNPLDLVVAGTDRIPLPRTAIEASLGFGVQGEILGHFGRVQRVRIGEYEVENVLAGFRPAQNEGVLGDRSFIGLPLLSRFNLVFDYPGAKMYLKPSRQFAEPFHFDMSGMRLRREPGGTMAVVAVYPGSAAARAGIQVGDSVTSVNGRPVGEYAPGELRPVFTHEGATVRLKIERAGDALDATLVLQPVI